MVKTLFVDMNGVRVGTLELRHGELRFSYAEDWLRRKERRSISLSLNIGAGSHAGARVLNFFNNLLPDDTKVLGAIASKFRIEIPGVFGLLETVGRDCIGALQLYPEGSTPPDPARITYRQLTETQVEELLKNLPSTPLGMDPSEDFRISLAGAQQKTALLQTNGGWALPLEATPTTHILKTPIGSISGTSIDLSDSCENEWLCLEIARRFGLPTAKAEIRRFGTQKALCVERFDRKASAKDPRLHFRLPTEDFCQACGVNPNQKYEADGGPGIREVMDLLARSVDPQTDRRTFMAAQVLLWLLNSTDGHAKNYSIRIGANDAFRLAPLYDILSVEPLVAAGGLEARRLKLAMGLLGKNRHYRTVDIEPRHFISTAEAVGFPAEAMRGILEHFAREAGNVIGSIRADLPEDFPKTTSEPILALLEKRARKIADRLGLAHDASVP